MKKYQVTTEVTFTLWANGEEDIEAEVKNVLNIIDAEDSGYIEYEECE